MHMSARRHDPSRLVSFLALIVALALIGLGGPKAAADAGSAGSYASFSAWISSANIWTYTTPNRLDVNAYASYRDYGCSPSYQCARNVHVTFELRRGYSSYSPLMQRAYVQTGQYSPSVRTSFPLPSCKFVGRYGSQAYTIVMTAAAPNGQQRTSSRTVYQRSC